MAKRGALDTFFQPNKKIRTDEEGKINGTESPNDPPSGPPSEHSSYPFPIPSLPSSVTSSLDYSPTCSEARLITNAPDLDLAYYEPFVSKSAAKQIFTFLRSELFFYRVQYKIKRGVLETQINTPRYTTVFGVDASSRFSRGTVIDSQNSQPSSSKYKCAPRPIPSCLDTLRLATEAVTGETFNFCLVNYYATGADSISYHSDDEHFLGTDPAIASFSFGARRDFCMRHKPVPDNKRAAYDVDKLEIAMAKPLKLPLATGDMVLMRGRTQANWLHSIPKRKGGESEGGRINITFRKALVKGGTENYYQVCQ